MTDGILGMTFRFIQIITPPSLAAGILPGGFAIFPRKLDFEASLWIVFYYKMKYLT